MSFLKKVLAAKDLAGNELGSEMVMSQLESIEHHVKEIRAHLTSNEVAPDWVKAKIAVSADKLSDIAHYIIGLKTGGASQNKDVPVALQPPVSTNIPAKPKADA